MATNIKQYGSSLTIPVTLAGTYASGDTILLGDQGLFGLCMEAGVSGNVIEVLIPGGFVASKSVKGHDGTSNAAIAIYDRVYTDGNTSAFYDVNTSDTFCGYTLGAVASGQTETELVLHILDNLA